MKKQIHIQIFFLFLMLTVIQSVCLAQTSAWLPEMNGFVLRPSYTYQHYDRFWMGKTKVDVPFGDSVDQHTFLTTFEYGLIERLALDFTLGYTYSYVENSAFNENDNDGLADTLIGLRYNLVDEFHAASPYVPTLTLRLGGIIEGTYKESLPYSPGDGASGGEVSLQFGKIMGDTGVGLYGDIGYRIRGDNVPEDIFGSMGVFKMFDNGFTFNTAYRHVQGLSGLDIGGAGFSPDRFPELREISQNIEVGVGYTDNAGHVYNVFYARTVDGRNTGEKDIFGLVINWPF